MEAEFALALIMRWIHIVSAVVVVGSIFFYWVALRPVLPRILSEEQQDPFRTALMRRWKMLIHPSILFFLISGLYNYLAVTRFQHDDQPLYHILFGVKFLLAIVVFALALVATSTRAWSVNLRKSSGLWGALVLTSLAVVLLGGYMKVMPKQTVVEIAEPDETAVVME